MAVPRTGRLYGRPVEAEVLRERLRRPAVRVPVQGVRVLRLPASS